MKAGLTAKPEHFAGLKALRDRLGERFVGGALLNGSSRAMPFGDRLVVLPIAALWEN